jgi:CDP-diacylglycerol pyrophosphatase
MPRYRRWPPRAAILGALALALFGAPRLLAADPGALWKIVHDRCVPAEQNDNGQKPAPCELVNLHGHYAVLKDIVGATQYLVIPTDRVTGIEDPAVLAPGAPNYWAAAWQTRRYVADRAGRPIERSDISVAVNSQKGRSQNQLHFHVDCIRADVRNALAAHEAQIGPDWRKLEVPLAGHDYLVMRVVAPQLGHFDPFKVLAEKLPAAAADMGDQTLVLAGARFRDGTDGFYLLTDHADLTKGDHGSGEELQDHDCKVLK